MQIKAETRYTDNPLPDFSRFQWASGKARGVWEPRIASIGNHFAAAERSSVEAGIRSAALQSIPPEAFPELAHRAAARGLVATPISMQGRPEVYAASTPALPAAGPWDFRISLTTLGGAAAFVDAWHVGDDDAIGMMLGYPTCCRGFFARTWGAGCVDPTWEMDDHGDGPSEANILLRWLGVRYVPHMPCSFKCKQTVALGWALRAELPELERAWLDELLEMPMLWSALYGIGEVITPIVTLNFRSDVSTSLREIKRTGAGYPEAGADGLRFPFRPPPARRTPDSTGKAAKGPETSSSGPPELDEAPELEWLDNGFRTLEAQELAHQVIASRLPSVGSWSVLDLGCGNGLLARRIAGEGRAAGIELVDGVASRARANLDVVICGDIFAEFSRVETPADVVLFMPGRLLERYRSIDAVDPRQLLERLGGRLLVYAYGDWLERFGSLEALCHKAGMAGELINGTMDPGSEVAAGIWRWK